MANTQLKVKLKSWKGDYLHRPEGPQGVTTWDTGVGNEWIIEPTIEEGKVKLKSWKGDYLYRPEGPQGVTTGEAGMGNEWDIIYLVEQDPRELSDIVIVTLQSWKGDYLYRPEGPQGITTGDLKEWHTNWYLKTLSDGKVAVISALKDCLVRLEGPQGLTTGKLGAVGSGWIPETIGDGRIMLKSWKGDYLHRPEGPQGVTTGGKGAESEWFVDISQKGEDEKIRKREEDVANEKFAELETRLAKDQTALQAFFEKPEPVLRQAEIPCVSKISEIVGYRSSGLMRPERSSRAESENINVRLYWWGVDFIMNERLAQDCANGLTGVGGLGTLISSAVSVVLKMEKLDPKLAAVCAIIAACFAIKGVQIKITSNGNGVHWPITWLQWAVVLSYAPYGPAIIPAATLVFHPLRPEWCAHPFPI